MYYKYKSSKRFVIYTYFPMCGLSFHPLHTVSFEEENVFIYEVFNLSVYHFSSMI